MPTAPPDLAPSPRRRPFLPARLLAVAAILVGAAGWLLLRTGDRGADELPSAPARQGQSPASTSAAMEGATPQPGEGAGPGSPGELLPASPRLRAQVRGVTQDGSGRPLAGAQLTLHAVEVGALRGLAVPDGPELARTVSERDGSFELPPPRAGLARLSASAPGHGRAGALVDPSGALLTLVLLREALLEVEAVDALGRPVALGMLEIETGRERIAVEVVAGRAQVGGLPALPARLSVRTAAGELGEAGPVLLTAGETQSVLVVVAPGARLGGRVLAAETGEPIVGASVVVARPGSSLAPERSGPDGRFGPLLAGAPGDTVWLSVSAAGRLSVLIPLTLPAGPQPAEEEVRLEPGDPWPGRVEDEDGAPAADVEVGYTADGVVGREPATTQSDREGRFVLPPPPPAAPGRRIVLVARRGAALAALALLPGSARPEPLVLRLAAGAVLSGRVLDGRGRALGGVLVRAQPAWELAREERHADDLLHAVNSGAAGGLTDLSGTDGRFAIEGVPAGPWHVRLEQGGSSRLAREPFRVAVGEDLALGDLVLGGGLSLEGLVVSPTGQPLAGQRVRVFRTPNPQERPAVALSDHQGRFAFADLEPGRVWVEAEAPGGAQAREELDLPTKDLLTLRVAQGRALALSVVGADGPFEGLLRLSLTRPRQGEASSHRSAVRIERGVGLVRDVPPGRWSVRAEAGDLVSAPTELLAVEGERDASLVLRLTAPAVLEGRVSGADGAPAPGAEVLLRDVSRGESRRVAGDAEGRYRLHGLAAGDHVLTARGLGGAPVTRTLTLEAGRTTTEDVRLAPGGGLRVRVLDEQGRPVAGALLTVRAVEAGVEGAVAQGRTDREGRFAKEGLPAATLVVRARTRDGLDGSQRVEVRAGTPTEIDLRLARDRPPGR